MIMLRLLALAAALASANSFASDVYKAKCALCHDAGATGAPRIDRPADWAKRAGKGYAGLLRSAVQGVPNTAMLPKAGFPELSENEVDEALRHMVSTLGLRLGEPAKERGGVEKQARQRAPRVDDRTLAAAVAGALRGVRVGGVQVEAHDGRVTLKGMVDDAAAAARALTAAQAVAGVREIENRLVSAEIFEHD
jgi:cytochrome c5